MRTIAIEFLTKLPKTSPKTITKSLKKLDKEVFFTKDASANKPLTLTAQQKNNKLVLNSFSWFSIVRTLFVPKAHKVILYNSEGCNLKFARIVSLSLCKLMSRFFLLSWKDVLKTIWDYIGTERYVITWKVDITGMQAS